MNVSDKERELFYKLMGHIQKINKTIYQAPAGIMEATKVGKFILVIDEGKFLLLQLYCTQLYTSKCTYFSSFYKIRVYSWKCGVDGYYRQMWQVSCRRQGMLTQGPAPDPKSKV